MTLDKLTAFRVEAREKGLTVPYDTKDPRYHFYLNGESLSTNQDPQSAWNLVKLARAYDSSDELLQLRVRNSDLEKEVVYWKPAHIEEIGDWISLYDHLEENGFDMKKIYSGS